MVGYALKYFSRCGEDLWECIVEECQKVRRFFLLFVLWPLSVVQSFATPDVDVPYEAARVLVSLLVFYTNFIRFID